MEDFKIDKYSKEIRLINQNHFLSLRKKIKNNEYHNKYNHILKKTETDNENIKFNFDIKKIQFKIEKEKLYDLYMNCKEEIPKLGYLMQMIITQDDNLIIFSLNQLNDYLHNINKTDFEFKNLKKEFNENMFKYLFDILDKKYKENDIALLLTLIINKLCQYDNQYCIWLIKSLDKLINIIKILNDNNNQNHIINKLFIIINNIFLLENLEIYKNDLEAIGKDFFSIIINSIYNIISNKLSKKCMSTILTILNNIFINRLFFDYVFKNADKIKDKEKNIFDSIKYIIKNKTIYELCDSSILCLYNFIEYYMEIKDKLCERDIDEINYRLCNMNIPKFIVPFIFDDKDKIINNNIKLYIFKILINTIYIGDSEYWSDLLEKNLISQIIKLQNFLLSINIDKNSSSIFEHHLLLIFNLVSTEYNEVISHITIKNPCISNLFKFFNSNNSFINKQLDLFLNILHRLIINQCKYRKKICNFSYVKTFLLSEGICEFFKKLLLDEKLNQDLIKNIFLDILALIEYYNDYIEILNGNIVLLHFQKIGMNDVINNYKSKIHYSNELMNIIVEVSNKLNLEK